jgi:glycosyltransferase involved in cell wall biosynthesis
LFFREGVYGHLVDPASSQQFADAICRLLQDPENAERMGAQARNAVLHRFNTGPEQLKLGRLYKQLVGVKVGRECPVVKA